MPLEIEGCIGAHVEETKNTEIMRILTIEEVKNSYGVCTL